MKYTKVIYLGIIPSHKRELVGGYATANKRNIEEYKKQNIEVLAIHYPILYAKNPVQIVLYLLKWFLFFFRCVNHSLFNSSKATLVHITPLYKYFIYIEFFLVLVFKMSNKDILTDIRAGSFIDYYNKNTRVYRFFIRKLLSLSKHIAVEGLIYKNFIIEDLSQNKDILYYPNYVKDDQILPAKRTLIDTEPIQIIYFGRITETKGIYTILKTFELLQQRFNIKLIVIGGFNSLDLKQDVERYANENLIILPPKSKSEINSLLEHSHFFIFPSLHPGEGQSNALTEAMAYGLVPVVSNNGFNKTIVDDCGIVLSKEASEEDYNKAITQVISNNQWLILSEKAKNRIIDNYSNGVVSNNFFNYINRNL
ncbi:glycosyltransferase family 4 protein [Winogradskyella arenosi]|uniref:Glycosyltransferase involved in cell wall biosynthesis n=1 Tax=Winogradskyella arenosi TaxID=533325 RepID=A0A368ZLV7_9FLAO|nr:glycosyltransferase family 4 protein [Winogradskyella arenosi]RCW93566.1 glycosyltransferase involved in cell wall biosynthesis [Winogradskyella arenosi]